MKWLESWKNCEFMDYGFVDFEIIVFMDSWILGLLYSWIYGFMDFETIVFMDYRFMDFEIIGSMDNGIMDFDVV